MKVLITGGAGYVGSKLTKSLIQSDEIDDVVIYDNLSHGHFNYFIGTQFSNPDKIKFVRADILDSRQLKKSMKEMDAVIHLAAKVTTPFANADSHFYEQVNHWGTAEVVYAAEEMGIEKFIYLSSTSVFGASSKEADEQTVAVPRTFYGISKMRGEEHVERYGEKSDALILRSGNVYGYSKCMRFDAVINRFMFDANFSNRIKINGTGKQHRAFIHVDYLVDTLHQSLVTKVPSGSYNLVDKNIQIFEIVDVLKQMYPDLEFLFSNQHMNLRELMVNRESKIYEHITRYESESLEKELRTFGEMFAF